MSNREKLLQKVLNSPNNVSFGDVSALAEAFGFEFVRQNGSHHFFKRTGYERVMNFQRAKDGKAKPYQVRQLLDALRDLDEID